MGVELPFLVQNKSLRLLFVQAAELRYIPEKTARFNPADRQIGKVIIRRAVLGLQQFRAFQPGPCRHHDIEFRPGYAQPFRYPAGLRSEQHIGLKPDAVQDTL
ncbi:hypothetical protein D3C74_386460 [compost metagenome]